MGVNGLWGSAGLALYGIVPGVLITLASWRAAFIVPGVVCLAVGVALAWKMRTRPDRRPGDARGARRTARPSRVLARLLGPLRHHGARGHHLAGGHVRRGAGVRDAAGRRYRRGCATGLPSWGMATQTVLWVGLATSMIYVVSGLAQYAMGRRIIDRYPLKTTYVDGVGAAGRRHAGAGAWATATWRSPAPSSRRC